ncbi:rifin [Plasmodium sp. gorilla clade G1]|nr:rifin [Plasmodium sp. gorilla clade G1]
MKIHYINILLFALPLNILVHNQRNHKKTILRTPKTKPKKTHRTLCECELYAPSNYDNDQEMKDVIKEFNVRTAQRFEEYNERMQNKRKQCKEQYDKDTQTIILKDKIQQELKENITALETNIDINDIPTCVCKKLVADKVEKNCLKCGGVLGIGFPGFGLIGGTVVHAVAVNAATKSGIAKAIEELKSVLSLKMLLKNNFEQIVTSANYFSKDALFQSIDAIATPICNSKPPITPLYCSIKSNAQKNLFGLIESGISDSAELATVAAEDAKLKVLNATFTWETFFSSSLGISLLVTVCIIIILLITYLILRHLRKNKMKKKLQYIKLLKE